MKFITFPLWFPCVLILIVLLIFMSLLYGIAIGLCGLTEACLDVEEYNSKLKDLRHGMEKLWI